MAKIQWQDNTLNNSDNVTYKATLYFDNRSSIQSDNYRQTGIIVAESGGTSKFHIDNIEIAASVGSAEIVTNVASRVNFTLTEPLGSSFFPALISAGLSLNMENILEGGFVLEIQFMGYDRNGAPKALGNATWVWKLIMLDISAKHDASGAIYQCTAIEFDKAANLRSHNLPENQIRITADTLGLAVDRLEEELNAYYNNIAISTGQFQTDRAIINIPAEWREWQFANMEAEIENPTSDETMRDFTLEHGASVLGFIGDLILSTVDMRDRIETAGGQVTPDIITDATQLLIAEYFKIKTRTQFSPLYDSVRHEYARTITYDVQTTIENPAESRRRYEQIVSERALQNQKVSQIVNAELMIKRYDYLYTGLNTEVLNCDIVLNNAFKEAEMIYLGTTQYPQNDEPGQFPDAPQQLPSPAGPLEALQAEAELLQADIRQNASAIQQLRDQQIQLQRDGASDQQQAALEQTIAQANARRQQLLADAEELAQRTASERITRGRDFEYLGQIVEQTVNDLIRRYEPMHIERDSSERNSGLLALNRQRQNMSTDLLNLELEIRGDPYWLGQPERSSDFNVFDYDLGPPFLLFSQKFPREHNISGLMEPFFNPVYSGVYRVMNVIHSFRGGAFTQFLKGIRDMTILSSVIREMVDNTFELTDGSVPQTEPPSTQDPDDTEIEDNASAEQDQPSTRIPPANTPASANEETAMQFFVDNGFTPAQAAGIVGNLIRESGIRPQAINPGDGNDGSDSTGIAQWNSTRLTDLQNFAAARGSDVNSLDTQLNFILHEFNTTETAARDQLLNSTNVADATVAFSKYERYQGHEDNLNSPETADRVAEAKEALRDFNNRQRSQ